MKSAHGTIQGYNANAMTDAKAQVVVHAEVFGEADDASLAGKIFAAVKAVHSGRGDGAR